MPCNEKKKEEEEEEDFEIEHCRIKCKKKKNKLDNTRNVKHLLVDDEKAVIGLVARADFILELDDSGAPLVDLDVFLLGHRLTLGRVLVHQRRIDL